MLALFLMFHVFSRQWRLQETSIPKSPRSRTAIIVEEEEEPLLIYNAQGSPFRCKKLSVINGSPEHDNVLKLQYTYTLN